MALKIGFGVAILAVLLHLSWSMIEKLMKFTMNSKTTTSPPLHTSYSAESKYYIYFLKMRYKGRGFGAVLDQLLNQLRLIFRQI